jgi:hypothetical protein
MEYHDDQPDASTQLSELDWRNKIEATLAYTHDYSVFRRPYDHSLGGLNIAELEAKLIKEDPFLKKQTPEFQQVFFRGIYTSLLISRIHRIPDPNNPFTAVDEDAQ